MQQSSRQQGTHGLACRECQRKKIKCDRTFPCVQCTRAGIQCKASTRKPRAKAGKTGDAELRERILKLERLVETFQGEDANETSRSGSNAISITEESSTSPPLGEITPASPVSPSDAAALETSKYVAGTFWSSLTAEVKALADVFTESNSNDDDSPEDSPYSAQNAPEASQAVTVDYELIFCPPGVLYVMPGATLEPDPIMASELFAAYLSHVEPMFKIFHVPSLKAFMLKNQDYLGQPYDAPCNKAIKAAIFFAGMNAFTDEECLAFGRSRHELVKDHRRMVDIALYQADPLNSTELASVQALAIYVASIRVLDSSRRAWSMVALLDRIGRAIGLHRELPGEPIYQREIRRRLWYSVIFLDCFASIDRGTNPTIMPDSYNRPLPSNVNDADFDEHSVSLVSRQNELTDMSLALMTFEGSVMSLRIVPTLGSAKGQSWQKDLQVAYEFQALMDEKYFRYCDPTNPLHETLRYSGTAAVHSLFLRAVRPIQYDSSSSPPRVDSPWVMGLALNILRHCNGLWSQIAGNWRRMPWVPWHAIAVALAALCSIRDTGVANEAWMLVDKAMVRYAPDVADGENGMLWRPITKLYKKAAAFRDGLDSQHTQQAQHAQQLQQLQKPPEAQVALTPAAQNWTQTTQNPEAMAVDPAVGLPAPSSDFMIDVSDPVFDISPDMLASLPNDTSWLDWESIIKDIDEVKAEDMQWV